MECIAFGYPVPHYNWTRKNSFIPKSAIVTNYNRVLILPRVDVEDQVGLVISNFWKLAKHAENFENFLPQLDVSVCINSTL